MKSLNSLGGRRLLLDFCLKSYDLKKYTSILFLIQTTLFVQGQTWQNVNYISSYTSTTFDARTTNTSKPVGVLLGKADVKNGAATYSIPIFSAPRPEGGIIAPEISINYNSLSGDGELGRGWSIGGVSSIMRTQKTIAHNRTTGPSCTSENEYTWDGQKLVLRTSYSNGEQVWNTEIESFASIKSFKDNNNIIYKWEITTKDGVKLYYGESPYGNNTRLFAQNTSGHNTSCNSSAGAYVGFYLDYMEFPNGQGRWYYYHYPNDRSVYISKVEDEYGSTNFSYRIRSDINYTYLNGRKFVNDLLLDKIEVKNYSGNLLKVFSFKYSKDEVNSFLSEVTESNSGWSTFALNSTIFLYDQQNSTSNFVTQSDDYTISTPNNNEFELQGGDYNGDGISDLLVLDKSTNNSNQYITGYRIYKSWIRGSDDVVTVNGASETISTDALFQQSDNKHLNIQSSDLNGDNRDDLIIHNISSANNQIDLTNSIIRFFDPNGSYVQSSATVNRPVYNGVVHYVIPPNNRFYISGDFDGDGATDFIYILSPSAANPSYRCFLSLPSKNSYANCLGNASTGNPINNWYDADDLKIIDMDGDGKSEVMVIKNGNTEIYNISPSGSGSLVYLAKLVYTGGFPTKWHKVLLGDFNGDRKTDIMTKSDVTGWEVSLSNGNNFEYITTVGFLTAPDLSNSSSAHLFEIADFNGDGKADIVHSYNNSSSIRSLDMYYSTGTNFIRKSYSGNPQDLPPPSGHGYYKHRLVGDFNGDGKADINLYSKWCYGCTVPIDRTNLCFDEKGKQLFVNKIKNGYGSVAEYTYKTLSRMQNDWMYSPYQFDNNYVQNYKFEDHYNGNYYTRSPLNVVTKYKNEDGNQNLSIKYQGAMISRRGRGFLGFREINIKDNVRNRVTNIFYNKNYSLPLNYGYSGDPILYWCDIMLNDYTSIDDNQDGYTPLTLETTTNYYSNGLPSQFNYTQNKCVWPKNYKTIKTSFIDGTSTINTTYDNYGNVIVKSFTNADGKVVTNNFDFGNNSSNRPALPLTCSTTYTKNGVNISHTTLFEYTSLSQLQKKVDFHGLTKSITTEYLYNSLGNVLEEKITGNGMTPRKTENVYTSDDRFIAKTKNALGQETIINMNTLWNVPNSITDVRGLTTSFTYDGYGRKLTETQPSGSVITTEHLWDNSSLTFGLGAPASLFKVQKSCTGTPIEITYFDRTQKNVGTSVEQFNGGFKTLKNYYDARNRIWKVLNYGPGNLNFSEEYTSTFYDDFDRKVTEYFRPAGGNNPPPTKMAEYEYTRGSSYWEILKKIPTSTSNSSEHTFYTKKSFGGEILETKENDVNSITFEYNSKGDLTKTYNGGVVLNEIEYDDYGRKKTLIDNSAGKQTYIYNSLGELTEQKNPNDGFIKTEYDQLGRKTKETINEGTINYTYFPATGAGYKTNLLKEIKGYNNQFKEEYDYDALGRLIKETKYVKGNLTNALIFEYTYNANNQMVTKKTPLNDYSYSYKSTGHLDGIYLPNLNGGTWYYKLNSLNNNCKPVSTTILGLNITLGYNNFNRLNSISSLHFNESYTWDNINGNLLSKIEQRGFTPSLSYTYEYDNFERLTHETLNNQIHNYKSYLDDGRVDGKYTVADDPYEYHSPKQFAVKTLTNTYDFSPNKQDIFYTSFNRPYKLIQGSNDLRYVYNHNYERVNAVLRKNGAIAYKRYYANNTELTYDALGNVISELDYVYAGNQLIGIYANLPNSGTSGTSPHYFRVLTDFQGTIRAVSELGGSTIYRQNFDAWGNYIDQTMVTPPPNPLMPQPPLPGPNFGQISFEKPTDIPDWLYRGYTGHEHLPEFRLINMNARLYDPHVSRMLSPDNFVQTDLLQGFNRYSYANNNPCKYKDPDGNFFIIDDFIIGTISGLVDFVSSGFKNTESLGRGFVQAGNCAAIYAGMFAISSTDNFFSALGRIVSRFTWELPNSFLGILYSQALNTLGQVESVAYAYGATVVKQTKENWFNDIPILGGIKQTNSTGMTLGSYINGGNSISASADNHLFLHEYGHYLQSQASGPAYLVAFGLPSIFSSSPHNDAFPEQDANIRSWLWFNEKKVNNAWNTSDFAIGGKSGPNITLQHVLDSRKFTNYFFPNFWQ